MASQKLEERLDRLRHLRTTPLDGEAEAFVRKALQDRANLVVAEATKVISAHRLTGLIPNMLIAFDRLFDDPVKRDPKCWAKTAIIKTLTEFDYDQSPPFIRGSKHIQMEPVWGGQEDSAGQFRGMCILALVQCSDLRRVEIMRRLVDALIDDGAPVRVEAVRALSQMGGDDAALLLRLKARQGDARPLIIGHAFDGLIALERELGVKFVAEYLNLPAVELRDEAALALGSSRRSDAVDILLHLIENGNAQDFETALKALSLHEHTKEVQERIEKASKARRGLTW